MTSSTDPSGARRALGSDAVAPVQLLSWAPGTWEQHARATRRALADEHGASFDLAGWVQSERDAGTEVAAVAYPNPLVPLQLDVDELARTAAGLSDDSQERRVFTGDTMPTSLRALRRWAGEQLEGSDFPVDDVVLALSELSTNVERHAGGWLTVDLIRTQGVLVVAVTDPHLERLPRLRDVSPDELTGRGLLVVASLSAVWGVVVRPSSKPVWAVIRPAGSN